MFDTILFLIPALLAMGAIVWTLKLQLGSYPAPLRFWLLLVALATLPLSALSLRMLYIMAFETAWFSFAPHILIAVVLVGLVLVNAQIRSARNDTAKAKDGIDSAVE
ncbi:MAG TPA: hypothetical protein VGG03_14495 [Thermoanaerobaculia bacterium]|jgi:hypothetical protein